MPTPFLAFLRGTFGVLRIQRIVQTIRGVVRYGQISENLVPVNIAHVWQDQRTSLNYVNYLINEGWINEIMLYTSQKVQISV